MSPAPPATPDTGKPELRGFATRPEVDFSWSGIGKVAVRVLLGIVAVPLAVALAPFFVVAYLFYFFGDLALRLLRGKGMDA